MKQEGLNMTRRKPTKRWKDLLAMEVLLFSPYPLVYKEDIGVGFYLSLPRCSRLKVCVCVLGV